MSHNPLHQKKVLCCGVFEPQGLRADLEALIVTTEMLTDIAKAMIEGGHTAEAEQALGVIVEAMPKFDLIRDSIRSADDKIRAAVRSLGEYQLDLKIGA